MYERYWQRIIESMYTVASCIQTMYLLFHHQSPELQPTVGSNSSCVPLPQPSAAVWFLFHASQGQLKSQRKHLFKQQLPTFSGPYKLVRQYTHYFTSHYFTWCIKDSTIPNSSFSRAHGLQTIFSLFLVYFLSQWSVVSWLYQYQKMTMTVFTSISYLLTKAVITLLLKVEDQK